MDKPFFNATDLEINTSYVGRLDMMGARASMTRSIGISANFLGKLHLAVLDAPRSGVAALVPTVDGVYFVCRQRHHLLNAMRSTLRSLASLFVEEEDPYRQFLVRGGIAYGPVVLGSSLDGSHSAAFGSKQNAGYRDSILIGFPVVQAYEVESSAPPFGVRVDVSARAFAPEAKTPMRSAYWRWHSNGTDDALVTSLREKLALYFTFMEAHEHELGYKSEDRKRHDALWKEYF